MSNQLCSSLEILNVDCMAIAVSTVDCYVLFSSGSMTCRGDVCSEGQCLRARCHTCSETFREKRLHILHRSDKFGGGRAETGWNQRLHTDFRYGKAPSPCLLWRLSGFSLFWHFGNGKYQNKEKPLKRQRKLGLQARPPARGLPYVVGLLYVQSYY